MGRIALYLSAIGGGLMGLGCLLMIICPAILAAIGAWLLHQK